MEHVVFYPSADGTPAFRRVPSLEDAIAFVEHLRNAESVTEFSVHALAEVPLSFRAYYHVEVPDGPVDAAPSGDVEAPVEAAAPVPAAPFAEAPPVAVPAPAAPPEALVSDAPLAELLDAPPAQAPVGDSEEVVPVPAGRRSMGFFARS